MCAKENCGAFGDGFTEVPGVFQVSRLSLFVCVCVYSPGIFGNPGESLEILTQDFYFKIKCRGLMSHLDQLESYNGLGNHVSGGG